MEVSKIQREAFFSLDNARYVDAQTARLRFIGYCLPGLQEPGMLPQAEGLADSLTRAELCIQQAVVTPGEQSHGWLASADLQLDILDTADVLNQELVGDALVTAAAASLYKHQMPLMHAVYADAVMPSADTLQRVNGVMIDTASRISKRARMEHAERYEAGTWSALGKIVSEAAVLLLAQRYAIRNDLHDSWVPLPATIFESITSPPIGCAPRSSWDISIWTDTHQGPMVGHALHVKNKSTTTQYVRGINKIAIDPDLGQYNRKKVATLIVDGLKDEQEAERDGQPNAVKTRHLDEQAHRLVNLID
jgi:hypothetical protein